MNYTISFSITFAKEFKNFPKEDQDKIIDFIDTYEDCGLSDFSNYEGKITPSWLGSNIHQSDYAYARNNDLWHYHVGIPDYQQVHQKYKTSDFLLHFQWTGKGTHITLVDLYSHYTFGGDFYLPPESYLKR